MTQQQAKKIRIGDLVTVRAAHVYSGDSRRGVVTAIDNPGREFGVRIGREWFTVFNDEMEKA